MQLRPIVALLTWQRGEHASVLTSERTYVCADSRVRALWADNSKILDIKVAANVGTRANYRGNIRFMFGTRGAVEIVEKAVFDCQAAGVCVANGLITDTITLRHFDSPSIVLIVYPVVGDIADSTASSSSAIGGSGRYAGPDFDASAVLHPV